MQYAKDHQEKGHAGAHPVPAATRVSGANGYADPGTTGQVMRFVVIPSDGRIDQSSDPGLLVLPKIGTLTPAAGRYVWHCHILEHEDNEMMRPYLVK